MGYSNVAGDLNVYGTSSLSDLVVRGGVTNYGSLINYGITTLGTATIANLSVTGNLVITATNTQTTNSLTINNAGTATALKVVQYEGGGGGHTHNVAEFWDFQTLAMVIDPEGNVGIHTTASPGYAFTALGGVLMDNLTLNTPLAISSGGIGAATAPTNYVFAGPSIGGAGAPSFRALVSADLPSSIVVSNISGNGAALYSLTGSNVTGNVARSDLALVVSQASQPNITSVGVLSSLTVGGILNSNLFTGNASGLANITGSNVTGNVANATVSLVVSQASQPNITSVGLLSNLAVSNSVTCTNVFTSNIVFTNPSTGIYSSSRSAFLIDGSGNFILNGTSGLIASTGSSDVVINYLGTVKLLSTSQGISTSGSQQLFSPVGTMTLRGNGIFTFLNDPIIDTLGTISLSGSGFGLYTSGSQQILTPAGQLNLLAGLQISGVNGTAGQVLSATGVGSGIQWTSNIYSANALTTTNVFTTNVTASGIQTISGLPGLTSLNVTGNVVASNALSTTNLFANTLTLANATSTINVLGTVTATTFYGALAGANAGAFSNIYSANALTTTNIVAAGFTSNVSNTNFFYSTLTVPFIYSTTLNVASTANVLTAVIQGSTGATSLNVTGNVNVSNTITATNIFATNVTASGVQTIAGITGLTSLNVTGNVVASNALTTTNVFTTNVTASGVQTIAGITGLTSLNVTGNVVASNALTTTNIFTTNVTASGVQTIAGLAGRPSLNVTGNIFASNALTTTNVFTTNVAATGQVTASGRTGVGVCPPIVYRQGAAGVNWNTPAANTSTVAVTSGAVQMQCGANTMVATTQFIPFPVSYTGNPVVLVTSYGTHGNIWVSAITTTNFSVSANTTQQFEWLSIGI